MIEIVLPETRHLYTALIDDMHRMRYDVVVQKWGWRIPDIQAGYDKDAFDTDHTVYMLKLDETRERVLGCCRFNPTTRPYMISELWPEACDLQAPPVSPDTWETSRFVVSDRVKSRAEYFEIMWQLGVGLAEYCVQAGIKRIVWFTDPPFYQTINSMMEVEPLGRFRTNVADQAEYAPAVGFITEAAITAARANLRTPNAPITFTLAPITEVSQPFTAAEKWAA